MKERVCMQEALATATPLQSCTDFNSVSTSSTNAIAAEQLASIVPIAFRFPRFLFPFSPF